MKIRAVIQARMGSSRLRGKTLSPVYGIPLLKRVHHKVAEIAQEIVIATSNLEEDDAIEAYCKDYLGCKCIRGDADDVLSRFVLACEDLENDDTILRITADNIFYQKEIYDQLLIEHLKSGNDYTGIKGLSHIVPEIINAGAIKNLDVKELSSYEKEHVTPFFIQNPNMYKTSLVSPDLFGLDSKFSSLLTIDTIDDRERIEKLIQEFEDGKLKFTIKNLYNWLKNN